jgi:uncharacterized protein (DUF2267 family)
MHREQFLERVAKEFPFQVEGGMEGLVHTVVQALRRHVSEGELKDVASSMPQDLATLLQ